MNFAIMDKVILQAPQKPHPILIFPTHQPEGLLGFHQCTNREKHGKLDKEMMFFQKFFRTSTLMKKERTH
jgi:hypothetical protein